MRDGFKINEQQDLPDGRRPNLFGPAVYFSDCVTKAATYSDGYLLICEVALGNQKVYKTTYDYDAHLNLDEFDTVFSQGSYGCKRSE